MIKNNFILKKIMKLYYKTLKSNVCSLIYNNHESIYTLKPKIFKNLDIGKTWNWYLAKVNPNGVDEVSSTKLSRALNAFSYLYENS